MGINGTYKISAELSARKRVYGLLATVNRLAGHAGTRKIPDPPDKEQHVQKVMEMFREKHEVIDSISVTIGFAAVTVRSGEGEMAYEVKGRHENDPEHVDLILENDEIGQVAWNVTACGNFIMIESKDELSEYVLEKQ